MNVFPLIATGVASTSLNGEILAIRYTKIVSKSAVSYTHLTLPTIYSV